MGDSEVPSQTVFRTQIVTKSQISGKIPKI